MEDIILLQLEYLNAQNGNLAYYNCDKCLNKGYTYFYNTKTNTIDTLKCSCEKIRKVYRDLENCGITKEILDKKTLDSFICEHEWQTILKDKVIKYLNENSKKWLFISSISGSGKTHLCTAIFKELILKGNKGKYFLWKDEISRLRVMKRSSYLDVQEKYEEIIKEIKTVDVLYIDDFLKLTDKFQEINDLELAYEILNYRYNNNLVTIISSEFKKSEIEEKDIAICGRINEMCDGYWIELKYEPDRNYRLKK